MLKRILIVDDEIDFSHFLKVTLELTGQYQVRSVLYSSQVLDVARDFKPQMILLDCMMPAMDGGELAAALQSDPALKNVPFAFLTATVAAPETSASRSYSGIQTYLPKSIGLSKLVEFIDEKLSSSGNTTPHEPAP